MNPSKPRRQGWTRRRWLSCLAAPWVIPASVLGRGRAVPPSERIAVAVIGLGAMGQNHLRVLLGRSDVAVVGICDVDRTRREQALQIIAQCGGRGGGNPSGVLACADYRELLAREEVDAVFIATPDHWHAPLSIEAVWAGKDVYCEKPVALNICEGRRMVEAIRRCGRVFQTGSQYRSITRIRRVCQFVREGGLGTVRKVFTQWGWIDVPSVGRSRVPLDPPLPAEPVPDGLDWDLWVGPAPWRPYNHHYHRNPIPGVVPWNFCEAFGGGPITNYHSHAADVIQYAIGMELSGPVEILHPSSGEFPTLTCRYANGVLLHHVDSWADVARLYGCIPASVRITGMFGGLFIGDRGWITALSGHDCGPLLGDPEDLFHEIGMTAAERAPSHDNDHHDRWLLGIRTRTPPSSHEEIGHRSASLGILVDIAWRLSRSLRWDPLVERFVGDDEANRLLLRTPRPPWTI